MSRRKKVVQRSTIRKMLACYVCNTKVEVDGDVVKVKCGTCACKDSLDPADVLQLQKEQEYTKEDWMDIINKKQEAEQQRIQEKLNVDIDKISKKNAQKRSKSHIKEAVKLQNYKKKIKKGSAND